MSNWLNRLKHLEEQHAILDKQVDLAEKTGNFSDADLTLLKKKRLHLRDEIVTLKAEHSNKE